MDLIAIVALISTFLVIGLGIAIDPAVGLNFEALSYFLDYPSLFVTVLGTQTTSFFAFPIANVKHSYMGLRYVFAVNKDELIDNLLTIIDISKLARKNILGIEDALPGINNSNLRGGLRLIVDRADREFIHRMLEIEIRRQDEEKNEMVNFFKFLTSISPAYGMVGTLIGLVILLRNLGDLNKVGPAMSLALITTFYGTILANVIYAPIANKIKVHKESQLNLNKMLMEGLMLIEKGERPEHIEQVLLSYFPSRTRAEYEEYKYGSS